MISKLSQTLPAWKSYAIERILPARATYHPVLPANLAMLSKEAARQFDASITFTTHHLYRLHNVHVTWDGAVFNNLRVFAPSIVQARFVSRFQDTLLLRQWLGEKIVPTGCVAVCHDQWSTENYYHWLVDSLPRLLLLRQTHPNISLLLPQPLPPKQIPDYIVQSATVLGFTHYVPLNTRQILRASCVVLPELTAASLTQNPDLIHQVRTELLAALSSPDSAHATRKVYAARTNSSVRSIWNEAEVDSVLHELGFEKIYFEHLSFLAQIHLMQNTAVFLGVHGAGMTNLLFLQHKAKVIELLNEEYGDLCYFRLASCVNLPYFYVPCTGINPELANQSDMRVDISLLKKVVAAAGI